MKKLLSLLLVSIILLLAMTGCDNGDNSGDSGSSNNGGNSGDTAGDTNFSLADGKTVNIISDTPVETKLLDAIEEKTGVRPVVLPSSTEAKSNEIVIGNSNRKISEKAYRLLARIEPAHSYDQTYIIYSDGKSVAMAYNGYNLPDKYVISYLCEYFADNLTANDTVALGTLASGELDAPAYQEIKDNQMLALAWENLAKEAGGGLLGQETVAAFKKMYTLYNDNVVYWLADLFDPVSGGFYYSNSGRDTEGFLADIESTGQALGFLTGTGMTTSVYNSLSEEIRNKIVAFVKTRQDPNGYFYHPQWDREVLDNNITRLFRDISYGEATLRTLNARPTYTTPNGMLGDGIVVGTQPTSSSLTGMLGGSATLAVSKAIAVSDASVPERLLNEANFRAYLATLNINEYSYEVGSEIAGQVNAIQERDKVLRAQGASYSLVNILVEWMNSKCYPSTGNWNSIPDYEGNNGLLKISDAYNKLGAALPYPEAAVRSAVACITSPDEASTVCFPYNTWFAVNNVFQNVQRHDPQNADRLIANIRGELRRNVTETVEATYEKVSLFAKPDGSFSYLIGETANISSDMPVALPHTDEGDVNATFICMCGIASGMFNALGYTYIPQLTESDMMRFNARLTELGEIIKSEYPTIIREANFDDETPGNASNEITHDSWHTTKLSSVYVTEDFRDDREGNILRVDGVNDGGKAVMLDLDRRTNSNANCIVFEGEICFDWPEEAYAYWESDDYDPETDPYSGYVSQLHITGPKYNLYMLGITLNKEDDSVTFREYSSHNGTGQEDDIKFTSKIGEWFKIRIEYYVGDHDSVRIKIFFNDELYAVTDNYFSPSGNKHNGIDETQTLYTGTRLSVMSYKCCKVFMDNLKTYREMQEYKPAYDPEGKLYINVDSARRSQEIFDFEGLDENTLPDGLTVSDPDNFKVATYPVVGSAPIQDGNALMLSGSSKADFSINTRGPGVTATVFEADILYTGGSSGEINIYATERNKDALTISYALRAGGNGTYLSLYEAPAGSGSTEISNVMIPINEITNLRIEHYRDEGETYRGVALIYINGELVATSTKMCQMSHIYTANNYHIQQSASGNMTVYFDNIITERIAKDYEKAVNPSAQ